MSYTGIDRDDQVHQVQQCGCIAEVSQIITKKRDTTELPKHGKVFFPDFFLQTYPVSIWTENREKLFQFH